MIASLRSAGIAAAGALLVAAAVPQGQAADATEAVEIGAPGTLTKCQNWVLFERCHHYHHVALPGRVAVGDRVPLQFGSNNKQYNFPVARITLDGNACTVLSQKDGDPGKVDKIEVASCRDASGTN